MIAENAKPQFLFFEHRELFDEGKSKLIGLDIIKKGDDVHILLTATAATQGGIKRNFEVMATDIFAILFYAGQIHSAEQAHWYELHLPGSLAENEKSLYECTLVKMPWKSGNFQNPEGLPIDLAKCPFDMSFTEDLVNIEPTLSS